MKRGLLFCLLCLCTSLWTGHPRAWSAEIPFRAYSIADGLTQSDVNDIVQDHAGYLWISTNRGLNRFDGIDFEHFTTEDGLPNNAVTALYVGSDNTILVGDMRGKITILRGLKVLKTISPIGDRVARVSAIEVFGQSIFAVIDGVGIVRITAQDGKYTTQMIGDESLDISSFEAIGTEIWFAGKTGLNKIAFGADDEIVKVMDDVIYLAADDKGQTWLADTSNRIGVLENGEFRQRATIDSSGEIVSMVIDADGVVWAATIDTLYRADVSTSVDSEDAPVQHFETAVLLSSLFVDRENTLWASTVLGLTRFLGDRFEHHLLRTGPNPEVVWGIAEDDLGRFWFATENRMLLRGLDGSLSVVGQEYGVPDGMVGDVVSDKQGGLWFTVFGEGLYHIDVAKMRSQHISGTEGLRVLDIDAADDGIVWFSTSTSGVYRYSTTEKSLLHFDVANNMPVRAIDSAADGSVWYGIDELGLAQLKPIADGQYEQTIYGEESGLEKRLFNHINWKGPRNIWVATDEGGVYCFDSETFTLLSENTPFADESAYLVEPLPNGTVVVGADQGLYQFVPGQPGFTHYTQLSGFVGLEANSNATFMDSDNRLWIGTIDGATRMDVAQDMPTYVEPLPSIVRAETELDRFHVQDNGEIDPDQLGVQIEFAAVSQLHPKGIEYSYKLVGAEESWGMATTNRRVNYPRLAPASYEFMVRARYPGGQWSREFASIRFVVQPHFWQEPWFILSAALATLVFLRAAMHYRTRNIQYQNETLQAQVEERTRSIESAKQKLEASNRQLSKEMESRKQSDLARMEVETRFRRAFENAPIGMGLLDTEGKVFDANPALRRMFWSGMPSSYEPQFTEVINDSDKERFESFYQNIINLKGDEGDKRFTCVNAHGEALQTLVNLSPIASDNGSFLYAVLQVQDITESLKLTSQLEHQATRDELTGLVNRRAFEIELQRAWDNSTISQQASCLMFMDLDQFKVVNDTSGHGAGDQLLKDVSKILVNNVRANDIVARLGGDEFGLILWECPGEVAERIAESIRSDIENFRFHWGKEIYRIGVSIGGLPIEQSAGDTAELQQLADAACYAAKEEGRNRVHMVSGGRDSARAHRGQVRWVQRLREAMDNSRFAIYGQKIQPLSDVDDEPEHVEILLRLRHPATRKLIPPGAFLPAAERYGLSVELDQWVVSSLLNTLFVHQAFQAEPRIYWINLSGTSVSDKRFAEFLKSAIERSPLPPGTINFEITETAAIRNVDEAGRLMSELRDMGCKFALDDFGSGLSSFGYLKHLPVDFVKIDGMFIRDIIADKTNRIFVKSIIDIACSLDIKTTAEFVENQEMLDLVRDLGADYAQGFAIGRPFVLAPKLTSSNGSEGDPIELQIKAG